MTEVHARRIQYVSDTSNAIIRLRDEGLLHHGDNIVYEQNCPDCQLKTLWEISLTQQNKIESNCCLTCIALEDSSWQDLLNPI